MQDVVAGLRSGAHDYLKKPFVPPELLARVASAAHVKHLQDTLRRRNAELDRMSRTDVLTGLYNRRHLDEELLRRIKDALRYHALVVAERVRSATAAAPGVLGGLRNDVTYPGDPGIDRLHGRTRPACPIASPAVKDPDWITQVAGHAGRRGDGHRPRRTRRTRRECRSSKPGGCALGSRGQRGEDPGQHPPGRRRVVDPFPQRPAAVHPAG
jgi:hypothetical protein